MPVEQTTSLELLLAVARTGPPLRQQIEDGLRRAVRSGRLAAGGRLPSSRALAADLGVARSVVVEAYEQLVAEGYLAARHGAGTFVAPDRRFRPAARDGLAAPRPHAPAMRDRPGLAAGAGSAPGDGSGLVAGDGFGPAVGDRSGLAGGLGGLVPDLLAAAAPVRYDFRPGLPDLAAFPRAAWLRATRVALARLPDTDLSYGDPRGLPELREALAGYLGRVRGVLADPGQVMVTNGFSQGLSLVARALVARGATRFGAEDPGHPGVRDVLRAAGATVVRVPVDAAGARLPGPGPSDVDSIGADASGVDSSDVDAVLVTPAHQFPSGVVMSPARRSSIVDWARQAGGWVVEDDYDAEYRFDREPLGAVAGLDPDRVVYAGSASKSLAPALRIGWLVLPSALLDGVVAARRTTDLATGALAQAAFAELVGSGGLDRHLRRTRRAYRQRRDALAAALARHAPQLALAGIPAGLHAVATLPAGWDAAELAERAAAVSVRLYPMSAYRWPAAPAAESFPTAAALVFGYAALTPAEIDAGVRALASALPGRGAAGLR